VRKVVLGLVVLTALVVCCLIAGTPVNNDASRAATTAGIHLTAPPQPVRTAASTAAPLLAALIVALFGTAAFLAAPRRLPPVRTARVAGALLLVDASSRRGPPAPAA
jgi:hypothetical protein